MTKSPILGYDTDFANSVPNNKAFILSSIPIEPWKTSFDGCEIVSTTKSRCVIRHNCTVTEAGNTKFSVVFYEKAVLNRAKSGDYTVGKPLAYTGFVYV